MHLSAQWRGPIARFRLTLTFRAKRGCSLKKGDNYGDHNGWIPRGTAHEAFLVKTPKPQFIGTFLKASGEPRTMRFVTSPENLRKGGLITVFDLEKRSLRKFNLTTLVGRLSAVAPDGQLSFCA